MNLTFCILMELFILVEENANWSADISKVCLHTRVRHGVSYYILLLISL